VIAVRENRNLMRNELARLPWVPGQYTVVENYLEAVGAMASLKSGLSLESVRRPLERVRVSAAATKLTLSEAGVSGTGSAGPLVSGT
jgi:hypothetical protein